MFMLIDDIYRMLNLQPLSTCEVERETGITSQIQHFFVKTKNGTERKDFVTHKYAVEILRAYETQFVWKSLTVFYDKLKKARYDLSIFTNQEKEIDGKLILRKEAKNRSGLKANDLNNYTTIREYMDQITNGNFRLEDLKLFTASMRYLEKIENIPFTRDRVNHKTYYPKKLLQALAPEGLYAGTRRGRAKIIALRLSGEIK
jgi:hypothetical protein